MLSKNTSRIEDNNRTGLKIIKLLTFLGAFIIFVWNSLINAAFFSGLGFLSVFPLVVGVLLSTVSTYVGLILLDEHKLKHMFLALKKASFTDLISFWYSNASIILFFVFVYCIAYSIAYESLLVPVGLKLFGIEAKTLLSFISVVGSDVLLVVFSSIKD